MQSSIQSGHESKCDANLKKETDWSSLNNAVVYKIVEELEDWKEKQQEDFLETLMVKEKKHLEFLSSEWNKRKNFLQEKLQVALDHCDDLVDKLKEANKQAIETENHNNRIKKRLKTDKEEVERFYDAKFLALNEAARRVEDDLTHKVKLLGIDKSILEERMESLKRDNGELNDTYEKLCRDICELRSTSLRKDQIRSLLQQLKSNEDKLKQILKSKAYFKEQWAKSVREVHRIKESNQQNFNSELKKNRTMIDGLSTTSSETDNEERLRITEELDQLRLRTMDFDFKPKKIEQPDRFSTRSQPDLVTYGVGSELTKSPPLLSDLLYKEGYPPSSLSSMRIGGEYMRYINSSSCCSISLRPTPKASPNDTSRSARFDYNVNMQQELKDANHSYSSSSSISDDFNNRANDDFKSRYYDDVDDNSDF